MHACLRVDSRLNVDRQALFTQAFNLCVLTVFLRQIVYFRGIRTF